MADLGADPRNRIGNPQPSVWQPDFGSARRADSEQQSLATILNLIRTEEANTRLEIERVSGLGRAIVADRLATLIDLGMVDEGELGLASGGRAPRNARFRGEAGLFLVAVLGQSSIGVALSNLSGKLLVEHYEAADPNAGAAPVMKRLATLFDWALEQHRKDRDIWGIGIAVSGPVKPAEGEPFASPGLPFIPGWDGVPFVEQLVAYYRAPVWVRSNTQMMTLGELRAGSGHEALDMLFVDLGREIGAGIVFDGRLYRGAQGGAGLIGHIATGEDTTTVCKCGNTGCLEATAGSDAITRAALQAAQTGQSPQLAEILAANGEITVVDVGTAAVVGDAFSAELLARCGRLIGATLAALTNSFNPSLIVLGGALVHSSDLLLAAIREAVYRRSHPAVSRDLRIVRSRMGSSAAMSGAAFSLVDEIFAPGLLAGWISHGSPVRNSGIEECVERARQTLTRSNGRPPPPAGKPGGA